MKSTILLFVAGLLSLIVHCSLQDVDETSRIVIIGAGITGASAAYHLHLASPSNASITIFESDSRVGGKVVSLPIPDTNNRTFFETGAPHFFTDDRCLVQAAEELDLHLKDNRFAAYGEDGPYHWRKPSGVWDGEKITSDPTLEIVAGCVRSHVTHGSCAHQPLEFFLGQPPRPVARPTGTRLQTAGFLQFGISVLVESDPHALGVRIVASEVPPSRSWCCKEVEYLRQRSLHRLQRRVHDAIWDGLSH
jgi:hypothetical protein